LAQLENTSASKPDYFSDRSEEEKYLADDQAIDTFDRAKTILVKYSSGLPQDLADKGAERLQ